MNAHRFKNIEFLRTLFALLVVYCHLGILLSIFPDVSLYKFISKNTSFAVLAVDFFFILSGVFFKFKLNLEQKEYEFIQKKFSRIWSVVAFATIGYICLNCFNISSYGKNVYNYIYSFLLIDNIGITRHHCGPSWYVSVWLIVSLFYFSLFKNLKEGQAKLIIGILVWFAYTFSINSGNGRIQEILEARHNFLCMGLLRGLGGLGIGIFLCDAFVYFKDKIQLNKIIATLVEIFILGWTSYNMVVCSPNIHNVMIFIIAFSVLIFLFLIKKGYISQFLDNDVSAWIGKYSSSLFLTHLLIFYALRVQIADGSNDFIKNYPMASLSILFIGCFAFAILVHHLIEHPKNSLCQRIGKVKYYSLIFGMMLLVSAFGGYRMTHKPIKLEKTYSFNRVYSNIIQHGLSGVEQWGIWSDSHVVEMKMRVKASKKKNLVLNVKAHPYLGKSLQEQVVIVTANGQQVAVWHVNKRDFYKAEIPASVMTTDELKLKFVISNPISPASEGVSGDNRNLGIGFVSMRFEK